MNEVLFAVNSNMCVKEENISETASEVQKLLKFENQELSQDIVNMAKKIRCLK